MYSHLRQSAAPARDKRARLVPAADWLELGLRLAATCEEGAGRPQDAPIRYRDGLVVALLIACPMRIKKRADVVVGQ